MQPFSKATNTRQLTSPDGHPSTVATADGCAGILLDTVPRIMRAVRAIMASTEPPQLTVAQFRTLMVIDQHQGLGLSAVAEALALSLPSTSKLVDQLVKRVLLERHNDATDRRRMTLRLTPRGEALLQDAQAAVRLHLAGILNRLAASELSVLQNALGLLQESFPPVVVSRNHRPPTVVQKA